MPEEAEQPPHFTRSEFRDIGHNVQVREVYELGTLYAVEYNHECPKGAGKNSFIPLGEPDGWKLEKETPLTLSPSLLCRACGHHGFIEDNKWRQA